MPILILLLLLISAPSWAATKYLDNGATGCSNPDTDYDSATRACGSGSSAVATTLTQAFSAWLGNANTLVIRAGTYQTNACITLVSGMYGTSANAQTIITKLPGEAVLIQKTEGGAGDDSRSCLFNTGSSQKWITWRGNSVTDLLEFDGGNDADLAYDALFNDDTQSSSDLTWEYVKVHGAYSTCIETGNDRMSIRYSELYDCGHEGSNQHHAIYWGGDDTIVEHNYFHDNYAFSIQVYTSSATTSADRAVIRYNQVANWGLNTGNTEGCIVVDGADVQIYRNTCSRTGTNGERGIWIWGTATNTQVYHNSVSNAVYGVFIESGASGVKVQNNNLWDNTTAISGSAQTNSHNLCNSGCAVNSDPLWTDPANHDLRLGASSPAINAGTSIVGYPYNGSAPDLGAFETFVHATCSVEDGDASTLRITFENNVNPPVLPTSSIAYGTDKITSRKATVNNVVTAAVKNGDNRVDLTLTDAIVNGNTVDYSYSTTSGNLTDSALIGGTLNQPFHALTNQSCTNNVGAAASHVFTQARYEFHGKYGTEAAPVIKPDGVASTGAAENFANMAVIPGGSVRVRFAVTCTDADCPPVGFIPRYSLTPISTGVPGAYTVVPDAFAADNIGFCGTSASADVPGNGTATTDQLSTSGTFAAGALVLTSNAIPTVDIALNGKTELEYCFTFDTDAASGDTYDFRLYNQDESTITYTVTPRITINAAAGGFGELWDLLMFAMLPVLGRIESQTAKPESNLAVRYPNVDQVMIEGLACTGLKTSGTGLKRTITCGH